MSKRMFSTDIIESDAFLDMPLTAQALYLHLNMSADTDGFVNPKRVLRMVGAASDDMQILILKKFVIIFDSGVIVIKHWWIHNTKRMDRYSQTSHQNELEQLGVKPNKAYTIITTQLPFDTGVGYLPATTWQPNGNQMATQSNSIQSNSKQFNSKQPGFEKSKTLDKKVYAKAVRADAELAKKEQQAMTRNVVGGKGYKSAKKIVNVIKLKKLGEAK